MAENTTAARPYAHAVFELAQGSGDLQGWSDQLAFLTAVVRDPTMRAVLDSPTATRKELGDLVIKVAEEQIEDQGRNLVRLLADNGKLPLLPDIAELYEDYRASAEGKIQAELVAARQVNKTQRAALVEALERRLGREVELTVRQDKSLIGGAIIYAGNLVIDGSLRGRLQELAGTVSR